MKKTNFSSTFNNTNSFKEKLKKNNKRKLSSQIWLTRQLNDVYVKAAKQEGYVSRAAYKLLEINEKYKLFKKNMRVVDLGASPGGWSQVVKKFSSHNESQLIALDLLPMSELQNTQIIQGDFTDIEVVNNIKSILSNNRADIVLSDMAPNATGSKSLDHLRIMNLVELTFNFACDVLDEGGSMVVKVFQGGTENKLLAEIKKKFKQVNHFKPNSSRKESAEMYLVAKQFKRNNN